MMLSFRSFRIAATVLAFTSLAACSKDKDETPAPADAKGMSWTVDGSNVTALSTQSTAAGTDVLLGGATATGGIFLSLPKTAGTYALSSTSDASAIYVVSSGQSSQTYDSTSGSIVVSSVSATNITGTFTFTGTLMGGTATKTLTNGKFNVELK